MARRRVGAALCSLVLCGCSGGGGTPSSGPTPDGSSPSGSSSRSADAGVPPEDGGPLTQLDGCNPPPPEGVDDEVEGLVLPAAAVLTQVQQQGGLIRVDAYVEQTPVEVRMFYRDAEGLEIFEIEDEIYEAEVLFGSGEFRSYVKALAVCERGSTVIAYVGPGDSGDLPSLGG